MFFREAISRLSESSAGFIEGRKPVDGFRQLICVFSPLDAFNAGERVTRFDAKYGVGFLHSDVLELILLIEFALDNPRVSPYAIVVRLVGNLTSKFSTKMARKFSQ
jgi:hypothetical protein